MPRIGVGGIRNHSLISGSSIGSNTETLPLQAATVSNVSIASSSDSINSNNNNNDQSSSAATSMFKRKATGTTTSFTLARSTALDASPTLPNRAPDALLAKLSLSSGQDKAAHKRSLFRAAERGRGDALPTTSDHGDSDLARQTTTTSTTTTARRTTRSSFRASERGRGELLPTRSSEQLPVGGLAGGLGSSSMRARSNSSSNVNESRFVVNRRNTTGTESLKQMTHSLRNRRSREHLMEETTDFSVPIVEDTAVSHNNNPNNYGVKMGRSSSVGSRERGIRHSWSDTFGKRGGKAMRRTCASVNAESMGVALLNMKRGHLIQACVMLAVTFFVWDSYYRAMSAAEQLLSVKHDEAMMMLHLKKLEEQSLHLHESISRLAEESGAGMVSGHGSLKSDSVDEDLIKVQYGQLKQMEDELTHEVKALQGKIQQTDRASIVQTYGEGPVQVELEIDFPGLAHSGSSHIALLLWYETPHAAWTLLDQVRQGLWDGAAFTADKNLALVAQRQAKSDNNNDKNKEKKLDFVEKGQKKHESWTVGLAESESGGISLFINLQDNTKYHSHDVCIGKIIDGFDTLQRLARAVRDNPTPDDTPVRIKTATGSHLTRRDSAGLI